jgi:hypothetical protein
MITYNGGKPIDNDVFGEEVIAAGFGGLPFSWGTDGQLQFADGMTQAQIDTIIDLFDAHGGGE